MNHGQEHDVPEQHVPGSLLALASLSLVVGAAAGLVGALFRLTLREADHARESLLTWAHGIGPAGVLPVLAVCAAATTTAAWLVRRFSPHASGSGIPHVEAVLHEEIPQAPFRLIPVKFIGGALSMGAGLALGREGPSVQMGASLAHLLGKIFRRHWPDCQVLLAAGAGAGLATAFNAPIAGAVFVLEELLRRFDVRTTIGTFGASAAAIAVSRRFLGHSPDFQVEPMGYVGIGALPVYLVLGLLAGLLGIIYNRTLLGTLAASEQLRRWPAELKALIVGAGVGLLAWFQPGLVGGGDAITQNALDTTQPLGLLLLVFLLRLGLGSVSYAARTPGGLFAPLLVLGALCGLFFGTVCADWFPALVPDAKTAGVVGMAALFTAIVRAPLTGIILIIEMTGCFTLLLPMLGACFAAMLVPTLLGNAPLYDSLRESTLRSQQSQKE
jgi:CIC family chloride channel protein